MNSSGDIILILKGLMESQRFAVLATDDQGQPYTFLMAFAATDDLKQLVLVTERGTHKHANLKSNKRVALLIDDRENKGSDTQEAVAITVIGEAQEAEEDERERLLDLYMARHPYLDGFIRSPSSAIVRVKVKSYQVVTRFQEVFEWHVEH
jgi:nitroimidazol reductase NimA-like FMN-containing flavoprotein (pyridoxamine 5'-phosphate oxidase superfamily)